MTMKPWEEDNNNKYLLMGIGPKNPNADLGKRQYDPNYNHYDPQPSDKDISKLIWGENPYAASN